MLSVFIRTSVLYLCVVVALRLMGKRQLGELQPSELVVALMIADVAAIPIESDGIPILRGIIPVFTLVLLEFLLSMLVLKSVTLRKIITGTPTEIIKDGKFDEKKLKRLRITFDDVMEQLRLSGYSSISEIDGAIIETNGQMSIIPKEANRPLVCGDLNLSPPQTHNSLAVISDGKLRKSNLAKAGYDEKWLRSKLRSYNIQDYSKVAFLTIDNNEISLQIKECFK